MAATTVASRQKIVVPTTTESRRPSMISLFQPVFASVITNPTKKNEKSPSWNRCNNGNTPKYHFVNVRLSLSGEKARKPLEKKRLPRKALGFVPPHLTRQQVSAYLSYLSACLCVCLMPFCPSVGLSVSPSEAA